MLRAVSALLALLLLAPATGAAADGQPARPPAGERGGPDPLRRARRHLPRQPARRLHGEELRRRLRDRPRDPRDPLPDLQRPGRRLPARHAPAELGLPADRPGAFRGPGPQPRARQRAVVPEPEAGVAAREARPPHDRGRGRLEAIDEDRLLGRPRAGRHDPGRSHAPRGGRPGRHERDTPALRGERVVFTSDGPGCSLEAQDFFDDDRKLTYSCYEPEGRSSAWTIDLATGERSTSRPRSASTTRSRASSPTAATPASRATTSRGRSATRPASATSTSGSSGWTGPAATSPGSRPSTTTRAGRPPTQSSRATAASWPSRSRAPPTRPASATASCCCTSTGTARTELRRRPRVTLASRRPRSHES